MNAPAQISPQRAQYEPTVTRFLPGCEGTELSLRCSLLLIRDNSAATLRHCSPEAGAILQHVHQLASQYAFASMDIERLHLLRYELVRLVSAASGLEQFAAPEENDACG